MNISVKCPNCFQQVSKNNRYCIFCGYDLSGTAAEDGAPEAAAPAAEEPAAEAAPYDGPRFCPRGHDVPDPSLGFCPTCGSPLVNEPAAAEAPEEPVYAEEEEPAPAVPERPAAAKIRKCACGYVCDDPDLGFCPACGLPLDAEGTADETAGAGWTCICGRTNAAEMNFCDNCGKPRGYRPSYEEPRPEPEKPFIPEGMKAPSAGDLEVKARYGNDLK